MRRLRLALSAVVLSTVVAVAASPSAVPEDSEAGSAGEAQYRGQSHPAGSEHHSDAPISDAGPVETNYYAFYDRWLAQNGGTAAVVEAEDAVSEGSTPSVRAPARALASIKPSRAYSQVVDNASQRRFFARGWQKKSGIVPAYGKDFGFAWPQKDPATARFRMRIPATDRYTVYARWPAARGNNEATRFGVSTSSGIEWTEVDQRRDGAMWVRLGAYEMEEGNRRAVRVSGEAKTEGRVVVDAIMVVRGAQAAPPQGDRDAAAGGNESDDGTIAGGGSVEGLEVVRRARAHIGTPYRHSPPLPCEPFRSEDCSCLTQSVFSKWLTLEDDPLQQWTVGESVAKSDLVPGDLVFFKEAGEANPITHVAIYAGSDNIIHASTYWGHVVERPMEHVSGYYGARRLR